MERFDAIVLGAGHNGLTAANVLQSAGLRTCCLEKNHYAGGMSSTVEVMKGFRSEVAGSQQFPIASAISDELEFEKIPRADLDVMSVALHGRGEPPLIQYRDPLRMFEHMNTVHGPELIEGMANLIGWTSAPGRALGRYEVRTEPKTYDEMYACATTESERAAITDMLFASTTEILDRHFPDPERFAAIRGTLSFLAANTTFKGPSTPGSAMALAFGLALPSDDAALTTKFKGGIGAVTEHLVERFQGRGGELRLRAAVAGLSTEDGAVSTVALADGTSVAAPIVVSSLGVEHTIGLVSGIVPDALRQRLARRDHRAAYIQIHFALEALPQYAPPYEELNDPALQSTIGFFNTPEELQANWERCAQGLVPEDPAVVFGVPTVNDPELAPPGKHVAAAFALWFPPGDTASSHSELAKEMTERVIAKITRFAPNFADIQIRHTTFTARHMASMFGAPDGDYCYGLIHPDQMGPHRPGPRGFRDLPHGVGGLYLGGAGCHGGPAISYTPGYNAAHQAIDDLG